MVLESFRVYPSDCLLGLSGHPSDRYWTTIITVPHNNCHFQREEGVLEMPHID